jgi:hypothetical protein
MTIKLSPHLIKLNLEVKPVSKITLMLRKRARKNQLKKWRLLKTCLRCR